MEEKTLKFPTLDPAGSSMLIISDFIPGSDNGEIPMVSDGEIITSDDFVQIAEIFLLHAGIVTE